jgi:hypothetical protein
VIYRAGYVVPGESREEVLAESSGNPSHLGVTARLSKRYVTSAIVGA